MLTLNLLPLFKAKGIDKPLAWMMKHGMTNSVAHKLLNGKFKRGLPMHHVATICEQLWCTPNDLFLWTPSNTAADQPTHPLQALKKKQDTATINELLKVMPPEKIEELKRKAEELMGAI